jgi:hypothetical protein
VEVAISIDPAAEGEFIKTDLGGSARTAMKLVGLLKEGKSCRVLLSTAQLDALAYELVLGRVRCESGANRRE